VIEYYVIPLDSSYKLVLGHNWLREWNPTIDWLHSIVVLPKLPTPKPTSILIVPKSLEPLVRIPTPPSTSVRKPHISLINTSAYQKACKLQGAISFQLQLSVLQKVTGYAGQVEDNSSDLSKVPVNYHQYAEIFSKEKSKQLPLHHLYNLFIQLESEKTPP